MASSNSGCDKRVLVTGLVTLDIIYNCEHHPVEGSTVNSSEQSWRKGGNAANTADVLALLNCKVELFSTLADNYIGKFVASELTKHGVSLRNCVYHTFHNGLFPTSMCILSMKTGTRSITHCRNNFPHFTFSQFKEIINCREYSWFHFEERCCAEFEDILKYVVKENPGAQISVEIEKPSRFESVTKKLLPYAKIVFLSKEMANYLGYGTLAEAISNLKAVLKLRNDQILICPWGESGAAAVDTDGSVYKSQSFPPKEVVDTIGAGDTFIAGSIFCLNNGKSLEYTIEYACKLAGKKCGMMGFEAINTNIV